MLELWCWRHPAARGAAGRCIGRTDLRVDPRKAKRLAHRIRSAARRHQLPRVLWVSTLRRAADVGRWLARWGWQLRRDPRLCELDFGRWDGQPWTAIAWAEVEAWQADLLHHAPGGGESLALLLRRLEGSLADWQAADSHQVLLVTHGGCLNALVHARAGGRIDAARWPAAPRHGSLTRITLS